MCRSSIGTVVVQTSIEDCIETFVCHAIVTCRLFPLLRSLVELCLPFFDARLANSPVLLSKRCYLYSSRGRNVIDDILKPYLTVFGSPDLFDLCDLEKGFVISIEARQ